MLFVYLPPACSCIHLMVVTVAQFIACVQFIFQASSVGCEPSFAALGLNSAVLCLI